MDYYSRVTFSSGDVICHAGRKGMKWGKHVYKKDKTSYSNSPEDKPDTLGEKVGYALEKATPYAAEGVFNMFINNMPMLKFLYDMYRNYSGNASAVVNPSQSKKRQNKQWGKRVSNRNMYRVRPTRSIRNA